MSRFAALLVAAFALFGVSAYAADSALSEKANADYLAAYAAKPGVVVRPSGLRYSILQSGFGKRPGPLDTVTVYYSGSLINGTVFDATEPGLPASLEINSVIPGWTEALQLMREGDHWQIVIPANLAYGARGQGGVIPPNQTLIFDLELIKTAPPKKEEQPDQDSQH